MALAWIENRFPAKLFTLFRFNIAITYLLVASLGLTGLANSWLIPAMYKPLLLMIVIIILGMLGRIWLVIFLAVMDVNAPGVGPVAQPELAQPDADVVKLDLEMMLNLITKTYAQASKEKQLPQV